MNLLLLCAVLVTAPSRPAAASRLLARLAHAIDAIDLGRYEPRHVLNARFQRLFPHRDAEAAVPLQQRFPPTTESGQNIAFALAFYHINTAANIHRLLAPYRLMQAAGEPRASDHLKNEDANMERNRPSVLQNVVDYPFLLWDASAEPSALRAGVRLVLDGYLSEGQCGAVGSEWRHHRHALLLAAAGSLDAQDNVASGLFMECGHAEYRACHRTLKLLARDQDRRIAGAARGILRCVVENDRQWRKAYGGAPRY